MNQPEAMAKFGFAEVIPLKTVTVPPYTTTNAVVYGENSFVVVDPGSPEEDEQKKLCSRILERKALGQKLLAVLLTHHHGDHSKGALKIRDEFSVPIMAHGFARRYLAFAFEQIEHEQTIILSEQICLKAWYTPGHSDDHLVFYDERQGVLIAGDMITDRGAVLIPPIQGHLGTYLNSLTTLTQLKLTAIIPAHGQVITNKPRDFLLLALKHRYERISAVLEILESKQGVCLDATEITQLVYGATIPNNVLFYAQLSVESSLSWLQEQGLAQKINYRWQAIHALEEVKESSIRYPLKQIDKSLRNS
jgi:ribonuclease/clavin/mitogillin